ncbi:class I SAM-dependent methyltransferase [Taibaiella koreensis]|uniref:class I SAM-dependent methyltransferase n=1 Tax=Taibaiella koreensis TaxID=1268548 RepID=UPI000E59DF3E|nr:class I SAM-dependent methyltransferase [Taibaiella koreensis]
MQSFANRLQKVDRHITKWAKRQGITCYRIYDLDMPEFPFCIDRYEQYLHIAEYKAQHGLSEAMHDAWLAECLQVISLTLQTPREQIFLKERRRLSRRTEQYEKVAQESHKLVVQEQGLQFRVNLSDYLDTGLFLDHRPLRKTFREEAAGGKRVLNLFAYTGAFSVYAAAGGAAHITTVDLSNTYLQWARENMEQNGLLDDSRHSFVAGDTMDFLKSPAAGTYDLVFVDPPAFSNSKKMSGTWDTQRDHPTLLHLILQHMSPGGILYFSNNLRQFEPRFERLEATSIRDISLQTIPEDFRNKKIHHCYRIVR